VSAADFGRPLPAVVTLDDLAALNVADRFGHRFEMSPEGALSITPLADSGHAQILSELIGGDGTYEATTKIPLAWLLRTDPAEHGISQD
jgi:hypothetical protein